MGLDCSHDAFHGAYSAFNRFRQIVAKAAGGSYPDHDDPTLDPRRWYVPDGWKNKDHPGFTEFMNHSDCDGEISPDMCLLVADELEALLPSIEKIDDGGAGHIARDGGYAEVARRFISGCRAAANNGEPLRFG